jgi:hypothetical protein
MRQHPTPECASIVHLVHKLQMSATIKHEHGLDPELDYHLRW